MQKVLLQATSNTLNKSILQACVFLKGGGIDFFAIKTEIFGLGLESSPSVLVYFVFEKGQLGKEKLISRKGYSLMGCVLIRSV